MGFLAYQLTDQQQRLVTLAGELANTFAKRAAEGDWEGRFPLENYEDLHHAGYLSLTIPREYGGWGASLLDVTIAQERLARGDASTALVVSMHLTNLARLASSLQGPNELFEKIARAVVERGALLNTAASEPVTGSPSRGGRPATIARRQADGSWRITGRKTYTTGSLALQFFIVTCSLLDEASSSTGLPALDTERGSFLIEHDLPGVYIEKTWNSLGMRGSGSNDLVLDDVHVGPDAFVEQQIPPGPDALDRQSAWSLPVAAVYLGIAQAARNEAIHFARQRRPNSLETTITNVPHIQDKAAKIDLALLQSRTVLFDTAAQFDRDPTFLPSSRFAAVKYLITNHAVEIVDLAMRLVGGASLSLRSPLQRYYRDVRAGLHHPPMDDATLASIARQAFEEDL